jgi:hypothetical protein
VSKKNFIIAFLGFWSLIAQASVPSTPESEDGYYGANLWEHRPQQLEAACQESFKHISSNTVANASWRFNGDTSYYLLNLSSLDFVLALIQKSPKKEFSLLDVGAGNCAFGANLQEELLKLQLDKTIHIVSVTGEQFPKDHIVTITNENTHHHRLGGVCIANLKESLNKKGCGNFVFDFALSHLCFIHLNDPLSTYLQVFDLLSNQGFLLSDTTPFYHDFEDLDCNIGMICFLSQLPGKLLFTTGVENNSLHTLFQKESDKPLKDIITIKGMVERTPTGNTYKKLYAMYGFKRFIKQDFHGIQFSRFEYLLQGDRSLWREILTLYTPWQGQKGLVFYPLYQEDQGGPEYINTKIE